MTLCRITDARAGQRLYRAGVEIEILSAFACAGPDDGEPDRAADYQVAGGDGTTFRVYRSEEPAPTWYREPPGALPALAFTEPPGPAPLSAARSIPWTRQDRRR